MRSQSQESVLLSKMATAHKSWNTLALNNITTNKTNHT